MWTLTQKIPKSPTLALAVHAKTNNPMMQKTAKHGFTEKGADFFTGDSILREFWNQANGLYRL
jgi:hypothetical protein